MNFQSLSALASKVVEKTVSGLPPEVARRVREVPIFLERVPSPADVEAGIETDTLGLCDEGGADAPLARICLWLENIWEYAGEDEEEFRNEVRITLLHEIGHLVGWGEDEVEERGLG